jgi:hypothetical protein
MVALLLLGATATYAQVSPQKDTSIHKVDSVHRMDSLIMEAVKENQSDNIPFISIDENDLGDGSVQNVSSALTAGRDPFYNAASYNFDAARFRIRGYDANMFSTYMNGVPMENLDNGFTPYGLWGGLNDVTRNRDLSIGLHYNTFSFGDIGSSTNIDSRASKQRKQFQAGYSFSNRAYTHRWNVTYGSGINKKGWAFVVSGSRRWAGEGYVPGTYYDGWSLYAGVDKKFGQKHLLSLVAFGASTESGKQGANYTEATQLTGTNYYNPYWGWQNGKKRNANLASTQQPLFILTHDFKINNKTSLITAVSYVFGNRGSSSLDWYNALDPRPDYYRNLPSYQTDPIIKDQVTKAWQTDDNVRQINWGRIYDANRANKATYNGVTGSRSLYIQGKDVINTSRFNFNTTFNSKLDEHTQFTAGLSYQSENNNYYKKIVDMLGGDYYVDLIPFVNNIPSNVSGNPVKRLGDTYEYNYNMHLNKTLAWAQGVFTFNHIDFFVAGEVSNTEYWRVGNYQNGLVPNNSYGKSKTNSFNNYALKMGFTFKIDGRNYFYINESMLSRPPSYDDIYISPRTRDFEQPNAQSEKIQTLEGGYVLNAPKLKLRVSGYYTEIQHSYNVLHYFADNYNTFVNYAISNIDKVHFGGELGFEAKVMPNVTVTGAASIGRYFYNSRQFTSTTSDNNVYIAGTGTDSSYMKNYRVGGTPQEAYSLGISYRSPNYWFVSLTGSYLDQMWLDATPVKRTATAVSAVPYESAAYYNIIQQQRYSAQYTLDLFAGYSWKLPRSWGINHKTTYLIFNAGIDNILNNKDIISGGYESLRFDYRTIDPYKFPPKYFHAYGLSYFASATLRF